MMYLNPSRSQIKLGTCRIKSYQDLTVNAHAKEKRAIKDGRRSITVPLSRTQTCVVRGIRPTHRPTCDTAGAVCSDVDALAL